MSSREPLTVGEWRDSGLSWRDLHPVDRWALLSLLAALGAILVHTLVLRFGPPPGLAAYVIVLQIGPYFSAAGVLLHTVLSARKA
jgi:uncharacterized membrane protein YhaH (DUF805 family)